MIPLRQIISARGTVSLLAGAAVPLAFSPYDFYIIAILSPALLVRLWMESSPRQAFIYGYLYGLGMFGVGTSWLHISINLFGGVNLAGAVLLTFLFIMFIALFPALSGLLSARLSNKTFPKLSLLLIIPACWTLVEWIRSWILTGFPWLNLGYSQIDSPLYGLAPVTGVFGISFAVIFTAGALVVITRESLFNRALISILALLLWSASWLSGKYDWTIPNGDNISVALVQGAVPQQMKWTPEMLVPTLERYIGLTTPYLGHDLIIWPEAAIPALYEQVESYINKLLALASTNNSALIIGLPYRDQSTRQYFNSVVLLDKDISFYFKRHLVAFGEYLPLDSYFREIVDYLNIPVSDFSAGPQSAPLLTTDRFSMGISICYEDTFGEEVIEALPDADILVNVSNDAWFGDSAAPHQHLQMARMRAIESGRYLLRSTNTGITAIIDEKGKLVAQIPQFTPATLTGNAVLFEGMTPYARTGNYLVIIIVTLILIVAFVSHRSRVPGQFT